MYSPLDHIGDNNIRMWSMETTDLDQLEIYVWNWLAYGYLTHTMHNVLFICEKYAYSLINTINY